MIADGIRILFVTALLVATTILCLVQYCDQVEIAPGDEDVIVKTTTTTTTTMTVQYKQPPPRQKEEQSLAGAYALSNNENKQSTPTGKKPLFVLHIGPRKTGTSTIQQIAASHKGLLQQDNFYYLGHYGKAPKTNLHALSDYCLGRCGKRKDEVCDCDGKWGEFAARVQEHFDQGHNVLLSDETFNRFFVVNKDKEAFLWDHLKPILHNWDVRIIFTYRRYHSFIPSSYLQSFHPDGGITDKRQRWPDDGGRIIPSFPIYFDRFYKQQEKQPMAVKSKWEEELPAAEIFISNMHQPSGTFVSNFFCQGLPEAEKLCTKLRGEEATSSSSYNSASTKDALHFDMIAAEAYMEGLLGNKDSAPPRPEVARAIEDYAENTLGWKSLADFEHLDCLSPSQSGMLLNMSMTLESELLPAFFASENGEEEIQQSFEDATTTGSFCSIDAKRTVQDPKWQAFFKSL